jgi:hypothetical protein
MPFMHLAEILQGFTSNKLVGVGRAESCSGNTPMLHLQELITDANMHSDFTSLCAFLHILPSGNTPMLHLQELITNANMHSDFTVLCAFLHILLTYILRMIRNTKSDCGGIEHLGKTFILGAVGGGPVIRHLTKKNKEG